MDSNKPLYLHDNNSSSSTLQFAVARSNIAAPSQISSVDFNNLRKQPTNLSDTSTTSTVTTKSNNPLSRLFTKNRSLSNVNSKGGDTESLARDDASSTYDEADTSLSTKASRGSVYSSSASSLLKLGKKSRSKFSMTSKKPDLSVHTSGHHGLNVPKKIRSATFDDATSPVASNSSKRIPTSSPASTFHSFFHRSHSNSQPYDPISPFPDDQITLQSITVPARNTITLSSNSSNSVIADVHFAMMFKFTDPNYSLTDVDTANEHSSLFDMHKKLMTPTDQFLLSRLNRTSNQEVGLGIIADDDDVHLHTTDHKNYAKLFNSLMNAIKPLICPSQTRKLSNGSEHFCLGMLLEDLGSTLLEGYANVVRDGPVSEPIERSPSTRGTRVRKSSFLLRSSSTSSLNSSPTEKYDDFRFREMHAELLSFLTKCMTIFLNDMSTHSDFELLVKKDSVLNSGDILPETAKLSREWARIAALWKYFNRNIRFQLLTILHPLQNYLNDTLLENAHGYANYIRIETENMLLASFRDVVVMPFVVSRIQCYRQANGDNTLAHSLLSGSLASQGFGLKPLNLAKPEALLSQEAYLLRKGGLLEGITNCFGTIRGHMPWESATERDRFQREEAFMETFNWLLSSRS